jgi:hypothetical protein
MIYLIAHLVRGKPTYDIAESMDGTESDPGPWFITSIGWRAYPYWQKPLGEIMHGYQLPDPPDVIAWPDYIQKQKSREKVAKPLRQPIDLEELGL